jgi:hypothetical protein
VVLSSYSLLSPLLPSLLQRERERERERERVNVIEMQVTLAIDE